GQREDHQVVSRIRGAQERPPIVDERTDTRVRIRMVRVEGATNRLDLRVDLDGVYAAGAVRKRNRDIGPAAGAHHQHARTRASREPSVYLLVEAELARIVGRPQGLVR